jgi:hypothetical protein
MAVNYVGVESKRGSSCFSCSRNVGELAQALSRVDDYCIYPRYRFAAMRNDANLDPAVGQSTSPTLSMYSMRPGEQDDP